MNNIDTQVVSSILKSAYGMFDTEHKNSKGEKKTLEGIVNSYEFMLNTINEEVDPMYVYRLNRILRSKVDKDPVVQNNPYRTVEVNVPGLGDAISPEKVIPLMNRLLYQISDENKDLQPLEKAALAKGGIFVIQPNGDGNKRTGTLLAQKILLKNGEEHIPHFIRQGLINITLKNLWEETYSWNDFLDGKEIYDWKKYTHLRSRMYEEKFMDRTDYIKNKVEK